MKKLISVFTVLVLVLIVASFLIFTFNQKNEKEVNKVYPNLSTDNIYEEINAEGFLRRLETKDSFLCVFAFPSCPWCQTLIPILNDVAKSEGLDTVYYIYLKDMRDNEKSLQHESYLEIYDIMKKAGATDESHGRVNAPTMVAVKCGKIVDFHLDTVPTQQFKNGVLPPLNDEEKEQLVKIIQNLINQIK